MNTYLFIGDFEANSLHLRYFVQYSHVSNIKTNPRAQHCMLGSLLILSFSSSTDLEYLAPPAVQIGLIHLLILLSIAQTSAGSNNWSTFVFLIWRNPVINIYLIFCCICKWMLTVCVSYSVIAVLMYSRALRAFVCCCREEILHPHSNWLPQLYKQHLLCSVNSLSYVTCSLQFEEKDCVITTV